MSFIQPCFIKKNTPELRKELENMGHVRYPYEFADWDDDGPNRKYIIIDVMYYTFPEAPTSKPKRKDDYFVDCGDNEELFLAIAAIRDDSNKNQLMMCTESICGVGMRTEDDMDVWNYSNTKGFVYPYRHYMECFPNNFRKATVNEIIEYFKNK